MTWNSAARFYRQLSVVHKAGISVAQAVEMAGIATIGHHRQFAPSWSRGCTGGSQLADQLQATEEDPLAVALMRAGERSGKIPEMARLLAEHYEHRIELRNLVLARTFYPTGLLHVALIVPALPKVVLGTWPIWTLLVGPGCLWALVIAIVIAESVSRHAGLTARLALRRPLSFFAMPLVVSNTCHVLRSGFAAGMLVPDALELAAGGCGNRAMAERLREAASGVRHERIANLTAALAACSFPSTELGLIQNAEFAGKLEEVLGQAATVAQESFRLRAMWAAKVATGLIYAIAMIVAVIVIFSMYSAVYLAPMQDAMKEMDGG